MRAAEKCPKSCQLFGLRKIASRRTQKMLLTEMRFIAIVANSNGFSKPVEAIKIRQRYAL